MTVNISNTNLTNSFEYWRNRTNELAVAAREKNVTVNSNTAIGNASVSGTFSADVLAANGTTQSDSTTTGALIVSGGAGVANNLHVGGTFNVTGTSNVADVTSTGTISGTLSGDGTAVTNVDAVTIDGLDSTDLTSNNYVQGRFTSNTYIDGRYVANNYIIGRYTSNTYATITYASNTYVKDTFTSNTYVDGRFVANNYIIGRYSSNAYARSTYTSNTYAQSTFLNADVEDTAQANITFAQNVNVVGEANLSVSTTKLPNGGSVSLDDLTGNAGQFLRVAQSEQHLVYSNSIISQLDEIGEVNVNEGTLANAHVLVYIADDNEWQNVPRDLIDVITIDQIDNVNADTNGQLLVKITGGTGFGGGTSNGFISGKLNSFSQQTFTNQTSNTLSYTSTSESIIQVFVNGTKLVTGTDYTANTTSVNLIEDLANEDIIEVVEFDPNAFTVDEGTVTDSNDSSYSDINLKTDLELYEAPESVLELATWKYHWKDTTRFHDRQEVGLIAQEVEEVIPQLVTEDANGDKMVDYGKMTAVLLSTIKQLEARITELETKGCGCSCDTN